MGKEILYEVVDHAAIITINRPKVLNAVSDATVGEIYGALDEAVADDGVKVVLLTGAGDKAFCAGHDISTFGETDEYTIRESALYNHGLCEKIQYLSKPVIAAVNGYAFGAGCEIAISCDFRVAAENARFGLPEVSLGIIPGQGGTQRLARLIGAGPAKYYTITCEQMKAERAWQLGLVEKVVPRAELLATCQMIAKKIMANGPAAVRIARNAINIGLDLDLRNGTRFEIESFISAFNTPDRAEGVSAFLEKRPPNFTGK
ncbi:MAG: enoyl-CoA hydratase/isomerase family protein [Peptococcaceae bacterium]|nr:enoyl-CoA hydratase/isomerase family protein [Peptococcaceae bacterium]